MKSLQTTFKPIFFSLILAFGFTSCSSDDDNPTPEPPSNSGNAHTYNISEDGQTYSGDVDNVYGTNGENGAISAVSIVQYVGNETMVNFSLKNNDIQITGGFLFPTDQNNNISLDEDGESYLEFMTLSGIGYESKSGTAKVTIGAAINLGPGLPQTSALNIEFEGVFSYNDEDNNAHTSPASGTLTINLPPGY